MLRFLSLLCLFAVASVTPSCKKDKASPPDHCFNISEYPKDLIGKVPSPDRVYFYEAPYFNPNNANEFICKRWDQLNSRSTMMIFDIQGNLIREISFPVSIWYTPKWSVKNWILFDALGVVYKVKSNGDSLAAISSTDRHHPEWNYDGSKILWSSPGQVSAYEISDESGNLLERLPYGGYSEASWSLQNGLIAVGIGNTVILVNDSTYERQYLQVADPIGCVRWLDNENLLYTMSGVIYQLNIATQQSSLIKKGCDAKLYGTFSISGDRHKIIASTNEVAINYFNKTLESYSEIYVMNVDGTDETRIALPKN